MMPAPDAVPAGGVLELNAIKAALAQLDELGQGEYGVGLEELLLDDMPDTASEL